MSALVDEIGHRLPVKVPISDVRLSAMEHSDGCLVQLNESAIVKLPETEQLEDPTWLGG